MEGDFATGYAIGQNDSKNCCSDGGMGMGAWGAWLFPLLLIGLLFGGYGGGFGFGGFGGGAGLQGIVTRADITSGFQFNNLENGVRGIQQGICDSTYALNNSIMNGFHGVDNAICNLGYNVQQGFNTLGYQNQQCCCETQRLIERGFCDIGYNMATNTSNIVQAGHNDTDRVIAKLDAMETARLNDKLDALRLENQSLRFNAYLEANQEAQTATLLRRLGAECPSPAYLVNAPTPVTFPVNSCGQVQFGGNGNGYGCGCPCGYAA
jgi:hypothetical protein